ncbi:putative G-protein coupled receptor [Aphis craccivora]|uniref:Putative G-protein coupled receptor n=1 Tax=Aphis craccivora TaxID=307492 RepID=A0A6G0YWJ9_APHCR|nr:putative G-protein coupled receptor [Aphis craccivora]
MVAMKRASSRRRRRSESVVYGRNAWRPCRPRNPRAPMSRQSVSRSTASTGFARRKTPVNRTRILRPNRKRHGRRVFRPFPCPGRGNPVFTAVDEKRVSEDSAQSRPTDSPADWTRPSVRDDGLLRPAGPPMERDVAAGDHRYRFGVATAAAAAATAVVATTAADMLVATVVSMWVLSAMAVTVRHGRSRMARWAQQQHNDLQPSTVAATTAAGRLHDPGGGTSGPLPLPPPTLPPSLTSSSSSDDFGQQQQHYRHKANALLRIVESQQQLGDNCTAGTDLNMGEGVVDRYAQVY